MKKLAFVTTAATALLCAASLAATPADAKTHHKKPAPAKVAATSDPAHQPGGPMRSGNMCWKDVDPWAHRGLGYWAACPK